MISIQSDFSFLSSSAIRTDRVFCKCLIAALQAPISILSLEFAARNSSSSIVEKIVTGFPAINKNIVTFANCFSCSCPPKSMLALSDCGRNKIDLLIMEFVSLSSVVDLSKAPDAIGTRSGADSLCTTKSPKTSMFSKGFDIETTSMCGVFGSTGTVGAASKSR